MRSGQTDDAAADDDDVFAHRALVLPVIVLVAVDAGWCLPAVLRPQAKAERVGGVQQERGFRIDVGAPTNSGLDTAIT